jgi:hypothetical protein
MAGSLPREEGTPEKAGSSPRALSPASWGDFSRGTFDAAQYGPDHTDADEVEEGTREGSGEASGGQEGTVVLSGDDNELRGHNLLPRSPQFWRRSVLNLERRSRCNNAPVGTLGSFRPEGHERGRLSRKRQQ